MAIFKERGQNSWGTTVEMNYRATLSQGLYCYRANWYMRMVLILAENPSALRHLADNPSTRGDPISFSMLPKQWSYISTELCFKN